MQQKKRRGAALILVMGVLVVVIVMAAYCINVAYMQLVRTELRAATDAAARAGAEALSREDSTEAAVSAAIAAAAKNKVGSSGLAITESDVRIGKATQDSKGKWEFAEGATPYSAVRVNSAQSTPLMMFGVTGRQSFSPSSVSTAAFSENEICLVVDRSHSMCFDLSGVDWAYPAGTPIAPPDPVVYPPNPVGSRWAALESGIQEFLDACQTTNATQRISLVTWGSEITLANYEGALTGREFPASFLDLPLTTDTTSVMSAITARGADVMLGGTNMSSGIDLGISVLTGPDTHAFASKTMIIMTDGKWNAGRNPNDAAKDAKKKDITIHTVTFLDTADQTDMKKVAKTAGGKHFHASDKATLESAFRELATHLPVVLTD